MFLTFSTQWNSIGRRNRRWKAALEPGAWISLHFHSSRFQNQTRCLTQTNTTEEGFSFSFHKNYKLGPTYPRLAIFSLRELNQTSPHVCFEGWNKLSVPIWSPWEPNLTRWRRRCQLGLLSINFVFRNVIFQPMVFPFVWAKYKWNFMRDRCKLSFPLPLAASPLARAFSRDSLRSPQLESLLAGYGKLKADRRGWDRGG